MFVDLKPQHSRATLMLVVGVGLVAFCAWGVTRPDLFEARALPIVAGLSGGFFVAVAVALMRVPRGLDGFGFEHTRMVLHEGDTRVEIGLGHVAAALMVDEPLGRDHPLLCLRTHTGSFIEVTLMRRGHIESMVAALTDAASCAAEPDPELPAAPIRLTDGAIEIGPRRFELAQIAACDFVHHTSVLGPGLVIHHDPPEPLPETGATTAALVMRRIAGGEHIPLPDVTRIGGITLALHIEHARTMMNL